MSTKPKKKKGKGQKAPETEEQRKARKEMLALKEEERKRKKEEFTHALLQVCFKIFNLLKFYSNISFFKYFLKSSI